jgi:hypothetical protein
VQTYNLNFFSISDNHDGSCMSQFDDYVQLGVTEEEQGEFPDEEFYSSAVNSDTLTSDNHSVQQLTLALQATYSTSQASSPAQLTIHEEYSVLENCEQISEASFAQYLDSDSSVSDNSDNSQLEDCDSISETSLTEYLDTVSINSDRSDYFEEESLSDCALSEYIDTDFIDFDCLHYLDTSDTLTKHKKTKDSKSNKTTINTPKFPPLPHPKAPTRRKTYCCFHHSILCQACIANRRRASAQPTVQSPCLTKGAVQPTENSSVRAFRKCADTTVQSPCLWQTTAQPTVRSYRCSGTTNNPVWYANCWECNNCTCNQKDNIEIQIESAREKTRRAAIPSIISIPVQKKDTAVVKAENYVIPVGDPSSTDPLNLNTPVQQQTPYRRLVVHRAPGVTCLLNIATATPKTSWRTRRRRHNYVHY